MPECTRTHLYTVTVLCWYDRNHSSGSFQSEFSDVPSLQHKHEEVFKPQFERFLNIFPFSANLSRKPSKPIKTQFPIIPLSALPAFTCQGTKTCWLVFFFYSCVGSVKTYSCIPKCSKSTIKVKVVQKYSVRSAWIYVRMFFFLLN